MNVRRRPCANYFLARNAALGPWPGHAEGGCTSAASGCGGPAARCGRPPSGAGLRTALHGEPSLTGLLLGCIEAKFCK